MDILRKYLKPLCNENVKKEMLGSGNHGKVFNFTSENLVVKSIPNNSTDNIDTCIQNVKYRARNGREYKFDNAILCKINDIPEHVITNSELNRWARDNNRSLLDLEIDPSSITEILFSIVASQLNTINFIQIESYDTCDNEILLVMEKIDVTLTDLLSEPNNLSHEDINIIFLQIAHIIYTLHSNKINHNDMHASNIGIIFVNENTIYNNNRLSDYEYLRYNFGNFHIDVKTTDMKYLVKLLDWGDAVKYSDPVILNRYIIYNGGFTDYFNYVYDWICVFQLDESFATDVSDLWLMSKAYFLGIHHFILHSDDAIALRSFKRWWLIYASQIYRTTHTLSSRTILDKEDFNLLNSNDDSKILEYIKTDRTKIRRFLCTVFLDTSDEFYNRVGTNFDLSMLDQENMSVFELIKQPFFLKNFNRENNMNYLTIG